MDSKEQKSISSWEELTGIAALIVEQDRLRAELAQRDDLIAAFDKWLESYVERHVIKQGDTTMYQPAKRQAIKTIYAKYNELKAQHFGTGVEDDDGNKE